MLDKRWLALPYNTALKDFSVAHVYNSFYGTFTGNKVRASAWFWNEKSVHNDMPLSSLHVDEQLTWRWGQARVLHLLKGLHRASHRVALVSQPGGILSEKAKDAGTPVHEVKMHGDLDPWAVRRITKIIQEGNYDIVHMHSSRAHMLGTLACAFRSYPLCLVTRRVDFPINAGHADEKLRTRFSCSLRVEIRCEICWWSKGETRGWTETRAQHWKRIRPRPTIIVLTDRFNIGRFNLSFWVTLAPRLSFPSTFFHPEAWGKVPFYNVKVPFCIFSFWGMHHPHAR